MKDQRNVLKIESLTCMRLAVFSNLENIPTLTSNRPVYMKRMIGATASGVKPSGKSIVPSTCEESQHIHLCILELVLMFLLYFTTLILKFFF